MSQVYNRFRILLAEKAAKEKRNISLNAVFRVTGIAWTTLQAWANNDVTRYDASVIATLCEYLDCSVGELIVFEKSTEEQH